MTKAAILKVLQFLGDERIAEQQLTFEYVNCCVANMLKEYVSDEQYSLHYARMSYLCSQMFASTSPEVYSDALLEHLGYLKQLKEA